MSKGPLYSALVLVDGSVLGAPADLRGAGQSDAPDQGYAKSAMARDMRQLMSGLGHSKVSLVGHDMGMMVA